MIKGSFTVTFVFPYWVGVLERVDAHGYSAARIIYGSEPSDEMILHSIRGGYRGLSFSQPCPNAPEDSMLHVRPNYKRQQRELRQLMEMEQGLREEAQQAIRAERERQAEDRRKQQKDEREAEEARKFKLRAERRKEKKKGH
jgi:hypothetical protein